MNIFITGISTNVGKTIAAAIVTEALEADYWKPVQAGLDEGTDSITVAKMLSNKKSKIHAERFRLNTPASPHYAAEVDGINISISDFVRPKTKNTLVIEGAGGLLVPLNEHNTVADLIDPKDKVIVVSRHYLGSISHTLLTLEALRGRNLDVAGIIFSGDENKPTETAILTIGKTHFIGRIQDEPYFDKTVVLEYASEFLPELKKIIQ